jgi:hypothetical protein
MTLSEFLKETIKNQYLIAKTKGILISHNPNASLTFSTYAFPDFQVKVILKFGEPIEITPM